MGEQGRLQTSNLSRKVPPQPSAKPVETSVLHIPESVSAEIPFIVTLKLSNTTPHPIHLTIEAELNKMTGILLGGCRSPIHLAAQSDRPVDLKLLPLKCGIQSINGLLICIPGQEPREMEVGDVLVLRNVK